ncbi:MAG: hypothetical protein PHG89_03545 [Gallionella sp.]|nr:hypothetical protein [Gallionella sp.]
MMLVIMVMGIAAILVRSLSSAALQIERDRITANALAQAKEALIGYATSVNLFSGSARLGDLPCPDTDNDGIAGNTSPLVLTCNLQSQRIGRLPWKTLGLPDLRDGGGERLWYAVSNNFKNSTRTTCTAPGQAGCLNSDTVGTITVRGSDGNIINDATLGTGVAAVIIAPGDVLQRQDGSLQNRSGPDNGVAKNTASNYLDIANGIDNASFTDSTTNGFIQGRIKDSNGNLILNDQLLTISRDNVMQPIQKRVAAEVRLCLEDYASNNNGRYPWATPLSDLGTYHDSSDEYFGRVSDDLDNTQSGSWDGSSYQMSSQWGTMCNTHTSNTPRAWWINWKEMVFYGMARSFRPRDTNAPSFPLTCATPGRCLNINDSNTPARFIVIVAGKKLSGQGRITSGQKSTASNYLEGGNQNADQSGGYTFTQSTPSASFNDSLVYK